MENFIFCAVSRMNLFAKIDSGLQPTNYKTLKDFILSDTLPLFTLNIPNTLHMRIEPICLQAIITVTRYKSQLQVGNGNVRHLYAVKV